MALLDCQVAVLANRAANYLASGQAPKRMGNGHAHVVPYQAFATADGELVIAVGNAGQFRKLCGILGEPGWADDPRFAPHAAPPAKPTAPTPLPAGPIPCRDAHPQTPDPNAP